eukprot:COSAG01_NODE_15842_length_1293_cov_2.231156_2_plen_197_part_00
MREYWASIEETKATTANKRRMRALMRQQQQQQGQQEQQRREEEPPQQGQKQEQAHQLQAVVRDGCAEQETDAAADTHPPVPHGPECPPRVSGCEQASDSETTTPPVGCPAGAVAEGAPTSMDIGGGAGQGAVDKSAAITAMARGLPCKRPYEQKEQALVITEASDTAVVAKLRADHSGGSTTAATTMPPPTKPRIE